MTVQVDSQPGTDQNMCHIDICFINNSVFCFKKIRRLEHMNSLRIEINNTSSAFNMLSKQRVAFLLCLGLKDLYISFSYEVSNHKLFSFGH